MAEKKRKFINVFDIFVVLVVAAVVFVLFKLGVFGNAASVAISDDIQDVTYVLQLTPMRYGTEQNIAPGDTLYESVKRTSVGTVVSVEYEEAKYYSLNEETGEYTVSGIEGDMVAYVTITTQCVVTDKGMSAVDGQEIKCGESFNVMGPGYFGYGTVLSIERGDGV